VPEQERPLDQIQLRGLRFYGTHGVLAEEHARSQPFEVDVDLFLDLGPAGASDELGDTVDYGRLCELTRAVVEGPSANLLEHLAERIADGALEISSGRARQVVVTLRKLRPPVPIDITSAAVKICRP